MKIVFCKISCMKYYKGAVEDDLPYNGGEYVNEIGYGHEEYNFLERDMDEWEDDYGFNENGKYCLGFVETKSTRNNKNNQFHIEKIHDLVKWDDELAVSGVDVIWCATSDMNETSVMGWYRNANVYRWYQSFYDVNRDERYYNVLAKSSDCVLLPREERHVYRWNIPVAKRRTYGFGQSMIWYASEEKAQPYLKKFYKDMCEYDEENWLYKYPKSVVHI